MVRAKGIFIALLVAGLILIPAACSTADATPEGHTPPDSQNVTFFPVQKPEYETQPYPLALTQGELVLDNGYSRLTPPGLNANKGLLIVWPPNIGVSVGFLLFDISWR